MNKFNKEFDVWVKDHIQPYTKINTDFNALPSPIRLHLLIKFFKEVKSIYITYKLDNSDKSNDLFHPIIQLGYIYYVSANKVTLLSFLSHQNDKYDDDFDVEFIQYKCISMLIKWINEDKLNFKIQEAITTNKVNYGK